MSADIKALLFIVLLALIILYLRKAFIQEAFEDIGSAKCGVGLAPCPIGTKCVNGFCLSSSVPPTPQDNLPVFP